MGILTTQAHLNCFRWGGVLMGGSTDWVESYKIRHDLGLELIPEDSSKWEILNKREEYKLFLKGVK